jgi:hypothetical protein
MCGGYTYSVNYNYTATAGGGIKFPDKTKPTFTFYSNDLSLAGKSYTFQILANFTASPPYTNYAQSTVMTINWLDPCYEISNTIVAQTINNLATTVLVPITASYTGWTTYLGNMTGR